MSHAFLAVAAASALAFPLAAQQHDEQPDQPPAPPSARGAHRPIASHVLIQRGPWTSVQVNVDAQGNNIPNDAANEPSIAIDPTDPRRLVIGWRQFDNISSNFRQNGYAYTTDGGLTWAAPGPIQPGQFNSDPVVDADDDGTFSYLGYPGGNTVRVWRSMDGGQTWSPPTTAQGGDKPWLAVDDTMGLGANNEYVIWQTAYGPNTFIRSVDDGLSFQPAVSVPRMPTFGTLTVAPNGTVYACGLSGQRFNSFVLARSTNAQNATQTPTFTTVSVGMGGSMLLGAAPNPGGLLGQADVAVDPVRPGNVYMLCSVDPFGSDPLDVHFVRSTDGGVTFGAPIRINDDPASSTAWQWFAAMGIAPDGRLDVVWHDTRNTQQSTLSETFYAYSLDGGVTWSPNIVISPQWNSVIGWPNQNKIGDYIDVVSTDDAAHLAYSATFNGEQDVYYARLGDCDGNGIHDGVEIQTGAAADGNQNGVPDRCDFCQQDLGFGAGLSLSLCGDELVVPGSRATLELDNAPASSPVYLAISVQPLVPPLPLAGGALVPDLTVPASVVFAGYSTDPQGRLRAVWNGGPTAVTHLWLQAATATMGFQLSNALEAVIGLP